MFFVHTTSEEFKNATITRHFGFLFKETRPERSRDYPKTIFFVMLRFQNVVRPHENEKPGVFEMLRSRDGLVWTVGLTVEVVLNFQIPPALCGRGLRLENRECWQVQFLFSKACSLTISAVYVWCTTGWLLWRSTDQAKVDISIASFFFLFSFQFFSVNRINVTVVAEELVMTYFDRVCMLT